VAAQVAGAVETRRPAALLAVLAVQVSAAVTEGMRAAKAAPAMDPTIAAAAAAAAARGSSA
jgi:hypothetical protein